MATPRPYGIGPYGRGYYERWRGTVYEVGGATVLSFSLQARPQRIIYLAAQTSIGFNVVAGANLAHAMGGLTSIAFALQAAPQRIIHAEAITQIAFACQAELIESWRGLAPCEGGAWQLADCSPGEWTPAADCSAGTWRKAA